MGPVSGQLIDTPNVRDQLDLVRQDHFTVVMPPKCGIPRRARSAEKKCMRISPEGRLLATDNYLYVHCLEIGIPSLPFEAFDSLGKPHKPENALLSLWLGG